MGENSNYHWTDNIGGPEAEARRMKQLKQEFDRLGFVADAQYGIPTKCPCGEQIKIDVSPIPKFLHDFDTLPGSRYFTCAKFKDDGFHFRQPWVFGVEEEVTMLISKVKELSEEIKEMQKKINIQAQEIAALKK